MTHDSRVCDLPPELLEQLLRDGSVDLSGQTLIVEDGEGNEVTIKIGEGNLCLESSAETRPSG